MVGEDLPIESIAKRIVPALAKKMNLSAVGSRLTTPIMKWLQI